MYIHVVLHIHMVKKCLCKFKKIAHVHIYMYEALTSGGGYSGEWSPLRRGDCRLEPVECHPARSLRALDDIVEIQTGPGREWMALCGCKAESVLPNYWETLSAILSGIPPDSIAWSGGLGLGNTSCSGALHRSE
jgi:hypothetical protein